MTNNYTEPQKLPMSGFWYILSVTLLKTIKSLGFPLIILFFSRKKNDFLLEIIAIAYPLYTLILAFIKLYSFRYHAVEQSLIIEFGLFKKEKINIPFKKITGIHIEEKLLHQPFGLALMKIETAGSNKTEGEIPSIEMNKALALKQLILSQLEGQTENTVVVEKKPALMQMSASDIFRYGLSDNHLMTSIGLLSVIWVYFWRIRDALGEDWVRNITKDYMNIWQTMTSYIVMVLIVLFIAVIISIAKTYLKFDGFILSKDHKSYQYQSGLLDKKNNVIPFKKVQFVRVTSNWWRKKWQIFTVVLRQSQGGKKEKQNKSANATFPVFEKSMYQSILKTYYDKNIKEESLPQQIHPSYWIRMSVLPILIAIGIVSTFCVFYEDWRWCLLLIPILIYQTITSYLYVKKWRYFINEDALQIESGLWGQKIELVQWKNVQNVIVLQTILQKRRHLANLKLVTASGTLTIPYIHYDSALQMQDHIVHVTSEASNHWT